MSGRPGPELTADEITLLIMAAKLLAIVEACAAHLPLTAEQQQIWDNNVRELMVRHAFLCTCSYN
jgi:hypothetical protein